MYLPANQAEFKNANQMAAGDTYNEVRVRLLDRNGSAVDLAGKTVTWSGVQDGVEVIGSRSAAIYFDGEVGIKLQAADPVTKGNLYLEFAVAASGLSEYYPAGADLILRLV